MYKIQVGDKVVFMGYQDDNPDPVFTPGMRLFIESGPDEEDRFIARPLDADDNPIMQDSLADTIFEYEVQKGPLKPSGKPNVVGLKVAKTPSSVTPTELVVAPGELGEVVGDMPSPLVLTDAVRQAMANMDVVEAARATAENFQKTAFTWGGLMAVIKLNKLYVPLGYSGKRAWQNFIEKDMAGVDYRRAQYWITTYTAFTEAGMAEEHVESMGWSKAKELARIARLKSAPGQLSGPEILKRDREKLLKLAENLTRDQLADHVRDAYMAPREPTPAIEAPRVRTPKTYRFWPDQQKSIEVAVAVAKKAASLEDDAAAMAMITTEWALAHDGVEVPIEDAIKAMELRYGVKLAVAGEMEEEAA